MSQNYQAIVYLKYQNLEDMLKVIIFSSQSMLGIMPNLYYINHNGRHVLFLMTGAIGGVVAHYIVEKDMPTKKYIQLKRLTGEYSFLEGMGTDSLSLYIPILRLDKSTLDFPT